MAESSDSGSNAILLVVLVIVLAVGAYFLFNSSGGNKPDIHVNVPNPVSGSK